MKHRIYSFGRLTPFMEIFDTFCVKLAVIWSNKDLSTLEYGTSSKLQESY